MRAALGHLGDLGFVERKQNQGAELIAIPTMPEPSDAAVAQGDDLLVQIASDRRKGRLAEQVAEQDLMQAYGLSRAAIKSALARLADLGVVERKLGYRWKFADAVYDATVQAEAFRFRLLVEPSGLLEPGFRAAAGLGRRHGRAAQGFPERQVDQGLQRGLFRDERGLPRGAGQGPRATASSTRRCAA